MSTNFALTGVVPRIRQFVASRSVVHSFLATFSLFSIQSTRFGTNIILARLLSPTIFGLLAIVTTIRIGVELLSDMGIKQSIIVSKDGDHQGFVEAAWALKILRGFVLAAIGAAVAYPMAALYAEEELATLLLVASIGSIITGTARPGPALLQRNRQMGLTITHRITSAITASLATIAFALLMPSALGVVIGGLVGSVCGVAIAFLIKPLPGYRPRLRKEYRTKIMSFGKWIFVASVIFFFAQNFDRLYLPTMIPLAIFGVYNISRSISDVVVQTVARVNDLVVLPAIARSSGDESEARKKLSGKRLAGLTIIASGLGVLMALADLIILFIFDDRYAIGTVILPFLFIGSWFTILCSTNESVLMGMSQTKSIAVGNGVKLVTSATGLPLAFALGGLPAGLLLIAMADLPRYLWLLVATGKRKMAFPLQDLVLFLVLIAMTFIAREALVLLGWVDGFVSSVQMASFEEIASAV